MGPVGSMMAGAGGQPGAGGPDQQLQAMMEPIRQIGQQVTQLQQSMPFAAEELGQINQLLKQVVIKAAEAQQAQTASGMAVPGGAGGM